jgi:hypothetical protein
MREKLEQLRDDRQTYFSESKKFSALDTTAGPSSLIRPGEHDHVSYPAASHPWSAGNDAGQEPFIDGTPYVEAAGTIAEIERAAAILLERSLASPTTITGQPEYTTTEDQVSGVSPLASDDVDCSYFTQTASDQAPAMKSDAVEGSRLSPSPVEPSNSLPSRESDSLKCSIPQVHRRRISAA